MTPVSLRYTEKGSVLIIVMIALALMAGLAALFSLETQGGVQETRNFRDDTASHWLARAGIEAAMQEMARPQTRCVRDGWNEVYFIRSSEGEETELERVRKGRTGIELEPGYWFSWSIRLLNERADLTLMDEQKLHRLFELGCNVPEGADRTALVNAVLDWVDNDASVRIEGAEEDYYQELEPPRHCKNAPFDSVEELLLVKGITPGMLWGSPLEPRTIGDYNLQYGGGIGRYLDIGSNNSRDYRADDPELKYILTGNRDETLDRDSLIMTDDEKDLITNQARPQRVLLIGRGWLQGSVARHVIATIVGGSAYATTVYEWNDNAADSDDVDAGRSYWDGYHPREDD